MIGRKKIITGGLKMDKIRDAVNRIVEEVLPHTCLYCGKELKGMQIKFCKKNCANLWHYHNNEKYRERVKKQSREHYEKNKNEPEYKLRQKEEFRKWIAENREHFNDLEREPNRLYQKKMREISEKKGYCKDCFKVPAKKGFKTCEECLVKARIWGKRRTREHRKKVMENVHEM